MQQQPQQEQEQEDEEHHHHRQQLLSIVSIRGSSIRYVHFPDQLDLAGTIRTNVERERNAARMYQKTTRKKTKS